MGGSALGPGAPTTVGGRSPGERERPGGVGLGILLNSFGLRLSRLATFSLPTLETLPTTALPAVVGEST